MYIARLLYPVKNLGPGDRLGIWVSGCSRRCFGCANPELQAQKPEHNLSLESFKKIIDMLPEMPKGITITGGEPFEQSRELALFCKWINNSISDNILVYTGYTYEQLRQLNDISTEVVLSNIAALIDGEYTENLNMGNQIKGSENQRLIVVNEKYKKEFYELDFISNKKRIVQPFLCNDGGIVATGFESPDFKSIFSEVLQSAIL